MKRDASATVLFYRCPPTMTVAEVLSAEADRLGLTVAALLGMPAAHVAALRLGRQAAERWTRESPTERAARAAALVDAIRRSA